MLVSIAKTYGMPQTGNPDDIVEFGLRLYRLGIGNFDINPEEDTLLK